jgi:hypothetical protein
VDDDLVDVLWSFKILQPVRTEIPQRHIAGKLARHQLAGRGRNQDLPAMTSRADPCRAVNVQARVIALAQFRHARVHTHPHAHIASLRPATRCKRPLPSHRRDDGVGRTREHHEEAVTLRADLGAAVGLERGAKQAPVLIQQVGIPAAQPTE